MLKIKLSKQSVKFIQKLTPKHQQQIALKIQEIRMKKGSHDSKQLKNSPYFRADVGEYRVIYEIEDDTILLVTLIGKRNDDDVYKKLSRQSPKSYTEK